MTKILLTGINGFVGHHTVEHILKNTDWDIIGVDALSYASSGHDRLRDIKAFDDKRVSLFTYDLQQEVSEGMAQEIGQVDYIVHIAADSSVDKSIAEPREVINNNINNTITMLEFAKTQKNLKSFVYFSTDEVFGTAPEGTDYKEGDRFNCGNPYSASKAGAECICQAYSNTYKIPIQITNTMNVIGERQHPEKFLPLVINKVLDGQQVKIHANPDKTEAGKRHYIHARNVANALMKVLETPEFLDNVDASKGKFNIVGELELDNLEFAQIIANAVNSNIKLFDEKGRKKVYGLNYELVDFHSSRAGHDLRYALDGNKLEQLGWKPPVTLKQSVENTVRWYLVNSKWLGR